MTSILNSDFFKLRRTAGFRALSLAVAVCSLVTTFVVLFIQKGGTVEGTAYSGGGVFGFIPDDSHGAYALASISSICSFAVAIFSGLFISTEFTQGTIRNALSAGVSRKDVYFSKLIVNAGK